MLMSGPWITLSPGNYPPDLAFQIVVKTPEEAYAADRETGQGGRRRHQGLSDDAAPLQESRRGGPQATS